MLFSYNNVGLVMHQAAENARGTSYITVITLQAIPVSLVSIGVSGRFPGSYDTSTRRSISIEPDPYHALGGRMPPITPDPQNGCSS